MLFKKFPHHNDLEYPTMQDLFVSPEKVDACPFDLDPAQWQSISLEMKRILVACLNRNPSERPSCFEIAATLNLPILPESIGDVIFEEMQMRRANFERSSHEAEVCAKVLEMPKACPEVPL